MGQDKLDRHYSMRVITTLIGILTKLGILTKYSIDKVSAKNSSHHPIACQVKIGKTRISGRGILPH